jgi:hypothetical protein
MKKSMFLLTLITAFLWIGILKGQSQPGNFREKLKQIEKAKKEFITAKINLKPEQEGKFWEVYDNYIENKLMLRRKNRQLRLRNFTMTATDQELDKAVDDLINLKQQEVDLEKKTKGELLKIINIRQLAELYRSEQEFFQYLLGVLKNRGNDLDKD